ncbi:MAG: DUF6573 family protein, partial [Verrucomicrobiota bacterium]
TRGDALEDGYQVDISSDAAEAGIKFPVFITRSVFDQFVAVPPGLSCQDEAGRIWDIVMMLLYAIRASKEAEMERLPFELLVRNSSEGGLTLVRLVAECGPLDFDDTRPAITIMLPDED